MYLKRFIRNVPELKDINKLVDVMCSGRAKSSDEIIQIYFDIATSWGGQTNEENQGRRGAPSRNITQPRSLVRIMTRMNRY